MKTCTVDGCANAHRARGLCSTHYNRKHQADRHTKVVVPCAYCGVLVTKVASTKYSARFCTLLCRDLWRRVQAGGVLSCPVPDLHPSRSTRVPATHPSRWIGDSIAVAVRDCAVCAAMFVAAAGARLRLTCSPTCAQTWEAMRRRDGRRRRRARERAATVQAFRAVDIYERDRWRCHLCGKRLHRRAVAPHPMSPSIDHLVPLVDGGDHAPHNVRAAHFLCNSLKGSGGGGEQLMLVG